MAGRSTIPAMQFDLSKISDEIQLQGINQVILARDSGVSVQWINKILNGKGKPSPRVLKKLARELGLTLQDLVVKEPKRKKIA